MSWLTRLVVRWRDRPDPALYVTGFRYTYREPHDETKATAAAQRAKQHDADQRALALKRAGIVKLIQAPHDREPVSPFKRRA